MTAHEDLNKVVQELAQTHEETRMPYTISAGDLIQYTIEYDVLSQRCMNVFFYSVRGDLSADTDGATYLDAFLAEMEKPVSIMSAIKLAMAPNTTILQHSAQKVLPLRMTRRINPIGLSGTSSLGDCAAPNLSGVITKTVDRAKRGGTGSTHIAGVPTGAVELGRLEETYENALYSIAQRIASEIDPGIDLLKLQPVLGGLPLSVNAPDITGYAVQNTIRVMRRRTIGVGI